MVIVPLSAPDPPALVPVARHVSRLFTSPPPCGGVAGLGRTDPGIALIPIYAAMYPPNTPVRIPTDPLSHDTRLARDVRLPVVPGDRVELVALAPAASHIRGECATRGGTMQDDARVPREAFRCPTFKPRTTHWMLFWRGLHKTLPAYISTLTRNKHPPYRATNTRLAGRIREAAGGSRSGSFPARGTRQALFFLAHGRCARAILIDVKHWRQSHDDFYPAALPSRQGGETDGSYGGQ